MRLTRLLAGRSLSITRDVSGEGVQQAPKILELPLPSVHQQEAVSTLSGSLFTLIPPTSCSSAVALLLAWIRLLLTVLSKGSEALTLMLLRKSKKVSLSLSQE